MSKVLDAARVVAILVGATISGSVSARTIRSNQTNLPANLAAAQPGDHIVLSVGGYGVIILPPKTWLRPIVIDASKAELTGIVIRKASGVAIFGGKIIGAAGYGVHIADSSHVSVTSMDISGSWRGVVIAQSSDVQIVGNKLHGLRTDGIDVVGQRIIVERNRISDMQPIEGDHPDGIQLWSADGRITSDVIIRNNVITGNSQGVFARSPDLGLRQIQITDNSITVGYPNGIVLWDANKGVVTRNSVRSVSNGKLSKAMVRIEGDHIIACGNLIPDVPASLPALQC